MENHKADNGKRRAPNADHATGKSTFFFLAKFDSEEICQAQAPETFGDLEALMNKIFISLEETEKVFRNQAKEILDRDLILVNGRTKLKMLQQCLEEKKENHERIERSMDFVLKLCIQINNTLSAVEEAAGHSSAMANGCKFTPERTSMCSKMLSLNLEQREMFQQISDTVLSINDLIDSNPADPIEQLTKILSLHFETLKMIESNAILAEEEVKSMRSLQDFYTDLTVPPIYRYFHEHKHMQKESC